MQNNGKKATMEDIAKRLNISKNSVSIALNNKKGVSDALRQKIISTARQMNYGNPAPSSFKSKCVISIIPEYIHNDSYFYSEIFRSIEKEATGRGCLSIMFSLSKESEDGLVMPIIPPEMDIAGFLAVGVVSDAYITGLLRLGPPVVSVDIMHHEVPVLSVVSSNHSGGYKAAKHLINKNHTRVGFIGPVYSAQSIYERWCGFKQAMEESSLDVNPLWNIIGYPGEFKLFDTVETLEPLVNGLSSFPTAWFCAGDRIAIALMNLLARKGVKIPEEISVIGFDDISFSEMVYPALTTMRVDRKLMGKLAVASLFDAECTGRQNIGLHVTLVERDSTAVFTP